MKKVKNVKKIANVKRIAEYTKSGKKYPNPCDPDYLKMVYIFINIQ